MTPFNRTTLTLLLLSAALPGCAAQRVRVNTFLSRDLPFPRSEPQPAAAIAVIVGTEPKEPLLEAEVARKLKHFLQRRGYLVADQDAAAYVLTCFVSIDEGAAETVSDYGYRRPRLSTSYVYTHRGRWSGVTLHLPGLVYRTPYSYTYTYYTRFCGLTLYEKNRWAAASKDDVGQAAVWTCAAASTGSSSDLRSIVNYLLAAAFNYFGADTGREVRLSFPRGDPQVREIALAGRQ